MICGIRNFSIASRKCVVSNRDIMYAEVPFRRGRACWTGIVKTWNGGIETRVETL